MLVSVIIPAFNESIYLGETLTSVNRAKALLQNETKFTAEIVVVDNDSDDSTADVARAFGATIATEKRHNIATVRNCGAKVSCGEVLIFVDADTLMPEKLLVRIAIAMSDSTCFGGAVDTDYRPRKLTVRVYLQSWRVLGNLMGMAQGATQFCRRDVFFALNGYDETLFMGEDVDLYWRLKRVAKRQNGQVCFIEDMQVVPSTRRFDQWPFWRTLTRTNPFYVFAFRRNKKAWRDWYKAIPR